MNKQKGFTLIELMVTVAMVAILAAIALPSYNAYIVRGRKTEGTFALAAAQVQMETAFQNTGSYGVGACVITPATGLKNFTLSCTSTATAYTYIATGSIAVQSVAYTVDSLGNKQTITSAGTKTCWVISGSEC